MTAPPEDAVGSPAQRPVSRVSIIAGVLVMSVGGLVLVGWVLDLHTLKAAGGEITMKANAALSLFASGASLFLLTVGRWELRTAGKAAAVLAGIVGLLTLSEHVVGWNLGIDELLFTEEPGAAATTSPGRMGPNASLNLVIAGFALLSLYRGTPRAVRHGQLAAAVIALFALVPSIGYLYGATPLYGLARYTGIALHTALTLLALSAGILAARSDVRPVAGVVSEGPAGLMVRKLFMPGFVLPIVIGYACVLGQRAGLFDTGLAAALMIVAVLGLLWITIWNTASAIDRTDRARRTAAEAAARAVRLKDEFLATLSHELRTPLNAMLGWTQMLQDDVMNAERRPLAAAAISRNGQLLLRLVEDLLDVSRIATGQIRLFVRDVNINDVATAAAEAVAPQAASKDVSVECELGDLPVIPGDAERLQQVVWNLLSNAIKFSSPQGRVAVLTRAAGGMVEIVVRDEGEGIDPAFMPHIFEPFRQGDASPTRRHRGLGLGLSIARRIVELHGGTVMAESQGKGAGATFTVRLPIRSRAPQGDSAVQASPSS